MSFIGNIASGIGALFSSGNSAPKITPGKGFSTSVSSPFYNFSKGALTATPGASLRTLAALPGTLPELVSLARVRERALTFSSLPKDAMSWIMPVYASE